MKMKRKLEDFGELSAAEQKIVDELDSGEFIKLHDGLPPDVPDNGYDVRATFIRYLALGGCEVCCLHEKGLRMKGARITDALDLEGCDLPRDLGLHSCRFEGDVIFRSAKVQSLFLTDSTLPVGLKAESLKVNGSVYFQGVRAHDTIRFFGAKLGGDLVCSRANFKAAKDEAGSLKGDAFSAEGLEAKGSVFFEEVTAEGEVRFLGAELGGVLVCIGAKFYSAKNKAGLHADIAFSADGLEAKGSVHFNKVEARGAVRFLGAKIGGNLSCAGASFNAVTNTEGEPGDFSFGADGIEVKNGVHLHNVEAQGAVRLVGAKLGGNLECDGAAFNAGIDKFGNQKRTAFTAEGIEVEGNFFLRNGATISGEIMLSGAYVAAIVDEADCWPNEAGQLHLDRFCYDAILGQGTVKAKTRIAWLSKLNHTNGFSPQPYEQLAKVLREMGHREDAREVLIKKEELQREAANPSWWRRVWNWVMRESAGYGYRPSLSLRYLVGLMLFGMVVFGMADLMGAVKPNSARVWHLSEWEKCVDNPISPKWCYLLSEKGESYPAFNPIIYSVDTLLPIVDLEMQGAWIPDDRASWWGVGARVYLWLHIALGWFFSLLAVAGFSGLIKPE